MKFLWESLIELSPESEFNGGLTYDSIICVKGVKPSFEDVVSKNAELEAAEPMRLLRIERNRLLAETDWISTRSIDSDTPVSQEWKSYRQALRDLPATAEPKLDDVGNLTNVDWPEVPE